MFVRELDQGRCLICNGVVGLGLKEEPTGWKVYCVCLKSDENCRERRVGTVSRKTVDHYDDAVEQAEQLVKRS